MKIINPKQAEELCKKWRKEHPKEAKELDEIIKDKEKLKKWLESKGFHYPINKIKLKEEL